MIVQLAAAGLGGIILVGILFSPALAISIAILLEHELFMYVLGGVLLLTILIKWRRLR
jgi:hypothetical protein